MTKIMLLSALAGGQDRSGLDMKGKYVTDGSFSGMSKMLFVVDV